MSFLNRVVLITGAGSGIGEAIALNFAKLSARLALVDVNVENLYKVAEQCEAVSKVKVYKVRVDVSNDEEIQHAVSSILNEYGKLDVVINCAGISGDKGILDSGVLDVFDKVISVNLRSMVAIVHYTAPALIETKGCIVNIASVMARMVCKGAIPYNVSKAGIVHFTKSVALELASKGVRVNCISPGQVKTNFLRNAGRSEEESDRILEMMAKMVPLQHNVEVGEVAKLAAYLASDEASSITVTEQCENLSKSKVFKVIADVSNDEQIEIAVNSILIEHGKIDVVINCAGIAGVSGILDSDVMSAFDKVIKVNLRALVAVTHYTATALIESKGCVINIASVMSQIVCRDAIPYNVSKAGVVHFTKSVALELASKGVRVNCISPGQVKTNILLNAGLSQEENARFWEDMAKAAPLQENVKVEDIAELAAYLASDKARSITGANFVIDSGLTLSGMIDVDKKP